MIKNRLSKKVLYKEDGLIPAVIQDYRNQRVLMMAYMSPEAVDRTIRTREVYFYSRSRKQLWHKGLTSGNKLVVKEILIDCDRDTMLIRVDPTGPACHTGADSCFFRKWEDGRLKRIKKSATNSDILDRIYSVILDRKRRPLKGSYVSSLFKGGRDRILKKIGEEAGELIISSKNSKKSEIVWEVADLWFHTLVMMGYHNVTLQDIYKELEDRFGKPPKTMKRGKKR